MIDICIATMNNVNWLRIFIDYLFKNTKDFKLYVSDSASTDGTCKYLSNLKKKYPDIVFWRHTKERVCEGAGINWGISQGSSEWILIGQPDTILPKDWFEKMSAHFTEGVGAVGPISDVAAGKQHMDFSYGQYEDEVDMLITFCLLTKRKVVKKIEPFYDEFYRWSNGDFDVSIRLRQAGYRLVIARDVFVKHFSYQSTSGYAVAHPELIAKERQHCIDKHGEAEYKITSSLRPVVMICIPFMGDVDHNFFSSLIAMRKPGGNGAVRYSKSIRTMVSIARNLLAEGAILNRTDYLLFIDSDMVVGEESLMRLLMRMNDKKISIIGALATKRMPPYEPCIMRYIDGHWRHAEVPKVPGVYEVDGIGMAFTLIRTSVFKDLKKPYFKLDESGQREDLRFCKDAKEAGHRVFVDTSVQVGHLGERIAVDWKLKSFNEELKKGTLVV